jgi:hypothetical protein
MSITTDTRDGLGSLSFSGALKSFFRHRDHYLTVLRGIFTYWRTNNTPDAVTQSLISLFCATGGESNDIISRGISLLHAPYRIENPTGVLNLDTAEKRSEAIDTLREQGFYVLPTRLPDSICDELLKVALTEPCTGYDDNGRKEVGLYNRESPIAVKSTIHAEALIRHPVVQKLISDMSIIWLAQEYLQSKPVLDHLVMWWISNINEKPDAEAAQLYHFDMNKVKFLKVFVYVTDVGPENGAHCFIMKSHKTGAIPSSLLERGYARIADDEVEKCYPPEDFVEITGPRGTIFVEDTRGLHKGKRLEKGDRLAFELEFSNSLFGSAQKHPVLSKIHVPQFAEALKRYPRLYSMLDMRSL